MLWNQLNYETQMKILDRIGDLIFQEEDEAMQFGIAAAITELELWSNSPIREEENLVDLSKETFVDLNRTVPPEFVDALRSAGMREEVVRDLEVKSVEARDTLICCKCWLSWLCKCYCHKKES
jgi:hypothetical protein